jgi:ribonucleoside-diphosphate reductase alpha chain
MADKRPDVLSGITKLSKTGCGNMYIVLNHDDKGKLREVFCQNGKSGTCARHWTEVVGRLLSILVKSDADVRRLVKTLSGISCQFSSEDAPSCADAIAAGLETFLKTKYKQEVEVDEGITHSI